MVVECQSQPLPAPLRRWVWWMVVESLVLNLITRVFWEWEDETEWLTWTSDKDPGELSSPTDGGALLGEHSM